MVKVILVIATYVLSTLTVFADQFDFGDYRSETLVNKAWAALAQNDLTSVLAYTNKCISLYAKEAAKMQAGLLDYPDGSPEDIFQYWALNDVATSYFIQAEAYRAANEKEHAKKAYNKVIKDFSFGQCWDTKGWFWKPAEAAKEKLDIMASGANWDFGDYTSSTLVNRAWEALEANDLEAVQAYTHKCIAMYSKQARYMQSGLKDYAKGSDDKIFKYWALNDVATGYYILGKAYCAVNMKDKAKEAYNRLLHDYSFGQTWDPGISEFSAREFKAPMTPEGLIKAMEKKRIKVPAEETPVQSLNDLLFEKDLYRSMPKQPDSVRDFVGRLEKGKNLNLKEIKWLNRTLIEANYPQETPIRQGWFWRPADGAKAGLDMIKAGIMDFGDFTSSALVGKAWAALAANDLNAVKAYVRQTLKLYAAKAREMQGSLKDYASGDNDEIFSYWALNDVGTALFILGEAYQNNDSKEDAVKAYKRLVNEFSYAQCWDPKGWFWKPAEAARQKLAQLESL